MMFREYKFLDRFEKAKSYGFDISVDLDEGIKRTTDWFINNKGILVLTLYIRNALLIKESKKPLKLMNK